MKPLKLKFTTTDFEADGETTEVLEAREWWLKNVFKKHGNVVEKHEETARGAQEVVNGDSAVPQAHGLSEIGEAFTQTAAGVLHLAAKLPGDDRERDALVLLLAGFRDLMGRSEIYGGDLMKALTQSGYPMRRVDGSLMLLEKDGLVVIRGVNRGKRYVLTAPGTKKAKELAREVIARL